MRSLVYVVEGFPRAPALGRVLDPGGHVTRRDWLGGRELGFAPADGEADRGAGPELERSPDGRAVLLERDARAEGDLVRSSERTAAVSVEAQERPHEPVLGARGQLQLHRDRPLDALHRPQELVRRAVAEVVPPLVLGERHRVAEAHTSGIRLEHRFDH